MSTSQTPTSTLGAIVGGDPTQDAPPAAPIPQADPATLQQAATGGVAQATPAPAQSGSRLARIVQAVANVASTALSGIPDKGRPSFVSGLGEGARSEQAAQANQQAIKFKTFDDQVRAAQLHNQDLELQNHTEAQQDAHQVAQNAQHDWDEAHGLQYTEIPNSGDAATNYLKAQSGNGGASIPPGTHLSADGKNILIPKQSDETQTAQLQKYNAFSEAYGLPALSNNAQFVPSKFVDYLQNALEGHDPISGQVIGHDKLPGVIADLQSTRERLAGDKRTDPAVLKQLDGTIGSMQAKLTYLDNHKAGVLQANAKATASGTEAAQTSPENIAGQAKLAGAKANAEVPSKIAVQDNAAGNKSSGDSAVWQPKVTADEKKKAELGENIAENSNAVAQMLLKRPNLVGAVAGRFTSAEQMMGNNDPDIAALGTRIHNIAMANSGVHGFRSQEGVEGFERQVLNNFRNGPQAVAGALKA